MTLLRMLERFGGHAELREALLLRPGCRRGCANG